MKHGHKKIHYDKGWLDGRDSGKPETQAPSEVKGAAAGKSNAPDLAASQWLQWSVAVAS